MLKGLAFCKGCQCFCPPRASFYPYETEALALVPAPAPVMPRYYHEFNVTDDCISTNHFQQVNAFAANLYAMTEALRNKLVTSCSYCVRNKELLFSECAHLGERGGLTNLLCTLVQLNPY